VRPRESGGQQAFGRVDCSSPAGDLNGDGYTTIESFINGIHQQNRRDARGRLDRPGEQRRCVGAVIAGIERVMKSQGDMPLLLDIGGEGRYAKAWNLNPSRVKTLGPEKGAPIERHIVARAEAIPLPNRSVRWILVERTPLREAALQEIARVIMPGGAIVLRHVAAPHLDRHRTAKAILPGRVMERTVQLRGQTVQETRFHVGSSLKYV
jgi:hypothetical protein